MEIDRTPTKVIRMLLYEGEKWWVDNTLSRSQPVGVKAFGIAGRIKASLPQSKEGILEEEGNEYDGFYHVLRDDRGQDLLYSLLNEFQGDKVRITIEKIED
jgi:hypothetical protein